MSSTAIASPTTNVAAPTTGAPSPTSTGGSGNGGPSSPLLFFVALGFGVVFTNLWIIVGVKYCFRYNQRNRARLNGDDPDAVDLAAMPRQRRRREKKLMSMDEVNEKFPLVKYKAWRTTRAEEGLPTAGGITTAPSRPASIKFATRKSMEASEEKKGTLNGEDEKAVNPSSSEHGRPELVRNDTAVSGRASSPEPVTAPSSPTTMHKTTTNDDDEEEADQIQPTIPAAQLPDPGDACAICLDTIEDDDDVRGLTCGHAFHASCVDPWLTGRRACCPLCKADYYTPKPRPEGDSPQLQQVESQRNARESGPSFSSLFGPRGRRPSRTRRDQGPTTRFLSIAGLRRNNQTVAAPDTRTEQSAIAPATNAPTIEQSPPEIRSWRDRFQGLRIPEPARARFASGDTRTPRRLEAGHLR